MQLMQVYSQKSTSTTLPFSSRLSERGLLLIQIRWPVKSGAGVPGVNSAYEGVGEIAAMSATARRRAKARSGDTAPPRSRVKGLRSSILEYTLWRNAGAKSAEGECASNSKWILTATGIHAFWCHTIRVPV